MQPIYRYFGGEQENLDYSEESVQQMFLWESYGIGDFKLSLFNQEKLNGYVENVATPTLENKPQ